MKFQLIFICYLFCAFISTAQNGKVSSKTNIKKGKLKNGFTYYLYNNPSSKGKTDFYLIQNVGAILEEDNQNGIAHFLEHMCFNGTKNFPGRTIQNLFEEKSLSNSINAATGKDATIYHLINIPKNDDVLSDQCLLILHDWCNELILDPKAIEKERPVILEEMRTIATLKRRLSKQSLYPLANNSKYSKRDVIGDAEVIKCVQRKDFVRFYQDWYRTDLQAIAVIGDFNIYEMETKIKNLFSSIPPVKDPKPRPNITIPDNKEILYELIKDPELGNDKVTINYRHKNSQDPNASCTNLLVNMLFEERLNELKKQDSLNFVDVYIGYNELAQDYSNYEISVSNKDNRAKEALTSLLSMHKDVLQNGFTENEIKSAVNKIDEILNQYKTFQNNLPNEFHIEKIKANFLNNEDILDISTEYKQFKKFTKNLSVSNLKEKVKELYSGKNKSIIIYTNGENREHLTKQEILDIENNVKPSLILAKTENISKNLDDTWLNEELAGSPVVKVEKLEQFKAEKWILKNGATVVYKECNTNRDKISLNAVSFGGRSLLKGVDLLNSKPFSMFSSSYGVKDIDKEQLINLLKDSNIKYKIKLSEYDEGILSESDYGNVTTLFELVYSLFETPDFYEQEFKKNLAKLKKIENNIKNSLEQKLVDSIEISKIGSERYFPLNEEFISNVSLDRIKNVYRDRFSDASNFTFYIIGGIGKSKAKKLAEKYIGSISSTYRNETYAKLKNNFPKGYTKKVLRLDMENKKARNVYTLDAAIDCSPSETISLDIINIYLQNVLSKVIREGKGGTYQISVKKHINKKSKVSCGFEISYDCSPDRAEELNQTLKDALTHISKKGIEQYDFDNIKKKIKFNNTRIKNNGYYYSLLKKYLEENVDRSKDDFIQNTMNELDFVFVNSLLKKIFDKGNVLDVICLPK